MSDWDWIDVGRAVIMFLLVAGVIFGLFILFVAVFESRDSVLLVEGYVEGLVIERDYGSTFYYAVIDGKYFKIIESYYNLLKVGDLVKIFESGRCVII